VCCFDLHSTVELPVYIFVQIKLSDCIVVALIYALFCLENCSDWAREGTRHYNFSERALPSMMR
jgi:hypothetical protein